MTVKKAKEFPVKLISIKGFLPGKSINDGIKASGGDYIVCISGHCIPTNNEWIGRLIKELNNPDVAGVYGRQQPFSYSSDLDKRDLLTVFGPDKKVQVKDSFFHNANSAFTKKYGKNFLSMKRFLMLKKCALAEEKSSLLPVNLMKQSLYW